MYVRAHLWAHNIGRIEAKPVSRLRAGIIIVAA